MLLSCDYAFEIDLKGTNVRLYGPIPEPVVHCVQRT